MMRIIDEAQADLDLDDLVHGAGAGNEPVVIHSGGSPMAVVFPGTDFASLEELQEFADRIASLKRLRSLQRPPETVPISDEEAMEIANGTVREAVTTLRNRGMLRYGDE